MADLRALNILNQWGQPIVRPNLSATDTVGMGTLNRNWWTYVAPNVGYFHRAIVDNISLETYELMYTTDETVQYAVEILILAALSRLRQYTHKRKRIEKFVRDTIEGMECRWGYVCAQAMSAVPYGLSCSEIVWKPDGPRVAVDTIEGLHPRSLLPILDTNEASPTRNRLLEVWQWPFTGYQAVLPLNKIILYSHRMTFGNYWGTARLKAAFKNWFIKDQLLADWAKALNRYGSPTTAAAVNNAWGMVKGPNGEQTTNGAQMLRELEQFRGGGTLIYEADGGNNKVELWDAPGQMGASFKEAIEYANTMIFRAFLVPSLLAEHGKHGSLALGQQHFDTFTLTLDFLLQELADVLIHQFVRRLIEINFGRQDDYGAFSLQPFQEEDLQMWSEIFLNAVNAGFMTPENQADLDFARDKIGLPEAKEGDRRFLPTIEQPGGGTKPAGATADETKTFDEQPPLSSAPSPRTRAGQREAWRQELLAGVL